MSRRALIAGAVSAVFVLPGAAAAEMPGNRAAPEITGSALTGHALVGHNGTWLYLDGSGCGPECAYTFAWERCGSAGCVPVAGAVQRVYRLRRADLGAELRVVVAATKYDCAEWNYAAGTQECRFVSRTAASATTDPVRRGTVSVHALARSARVAAEEARVVRPGRRPTVRLTVVDAFGRLVRGARVSAGRSVATTRADGVATIRMSTNARRVVVRTSKGKAGGPVVRGTLLVRQSRARLLR